MIVIILYDKTNVTFSRFGQNLINTIRNENMHGNRRTTLHKTFEVYYLKNGKWHKYTNPKYYIEVFYLYIFLDLCIFLRLFFLHNDLCNIIYFIKKGINSTHLIFVFRLYFSMGKTFS